jgi:RNA polymerase sigma-70 factor (ECF subfamily)
MTVKTEAPAVHAAEQASDEELLMRYRDLGDATAFESLIHRYERPIYRYLFRYLHNAQLAEEVFQATFLRVHAKRHLYTSGRPFRPWLYSIATRCAVDALRKEGRHRALSLDEGKGPTEDATTALVSLLESRVPSPPAELNGQERRQWARRAVAELPDHLRAVILLIYFQGLKYREAAEALEIPVGTIKSRAHQALLELNRAWRRDHREPEE